MKISDNPPHGQAHWQVAQADTRPKPAKELALPTYGLTGIKHETLTHVSVHCKKTKTEAD